MEIRDLVGYQLIDLNNEQMVVKKGETIFTLVFDSDYGDCCGYANVENSLFFEKNSTKRNPVITNIEYNSNGQSYQSDLKITLFGENKKIAEINAEAGSGSGWAYGASVTVTCNSLDIHEVIASW